MIQIPINDKTYNYLFDIDHNIKTLQAQAQLILSIYADALNININDYQLSDDFKTLTTHKEP